MEVLDYVNYIGLPIAQIEYSEECKIIGIHNGEAFISPDGSDRFAWVKLEDIVGVSSEMKIMGAKTPAEAAEKIKENYGGPYTKKVDLVVAPKHYADRKYQAILVLQDTLSKEEFLGYLKGNALKYQLRAGKKDNTLQELNKANVYLQWAKEVEEFGEMQNVPEYK